MSDSLLNGRYRIVKEIGHGGMGRVCLVEDQHRDNRRLALKTLLNRGGDPKSALAFMEEFGELAKLRHPNVAAAYDFGLIDGSDEQYFTTEFIQGVDLLKGTEESTPGQLIDVAAQLLRGLDFLHSNRLLHNDLKPANILVQTGGFEDEGEAGGLSRLEAEVFGSAGRVKIIDFGLLTAEGVAWDNIRGTPQYICPERIRCLAADGRADLYSLGCVLYHIAARDFPFYARKIREVLQKHLAAEPVPLAKRRPGLPETYVELVRRLMKKNPEHRFQNAAEALRFLGEGMGWQDGQEVVGDPQELSAGALLYREEEAAALEARFQAAMRGRHNDSCVVVEGPQGIGKSMLVQSLRGTVQLAGGAFVEVAGEASQGHLEPLRLAMLGALKTGGIAAWQTFEELGAPGERGELAYTLQQAICEVAQTTPVVLHFDDFQNASKVVRHFALELVSLLEESGGSGSRLLIIISRRPAEDDHLEVGEAFRLKLSPFEVENARSFIGRLYRQDDVPDGVLAVLTGIAQGNPGLLVELVQDLVERKLVRYQGSHWVFPPSLEGISLPTSVASALTSKLGTLENSARDLLSWVSLCHVPVNSAVLGKCTYFSDRLTESLLLGLVRKGFLTYQDREGERLFSFAHLETKVTVAGAIGESRSREMHQKLAHTLEAANKGRTEEGQVAEVLAHHWLQAGNLPGFLRFAPDAAKHLQDCGNFQLATEYHRRVVENVPANATGKKIKSLLKLSEMHEFTGDFDRVEKNLQEILTLGDKLLKPADRSALLRRLAGMEINRQAHAGALQHLNQARTLSGGALTPPLGFALVAAEAWIQLFGNDPSAAAAKLREAEAIYAECTPKDPREKGAVMGGSQHLANCLVYAGRLEDAAEIYRRNLRYTDELGQRQAKAASHCSLGHVLLGRGAHEEALEHLTLALDLGRELGDLRVLYRARERLGEYHCLYGELRDALRITQLGLEEAKSLQGGSATARLLRVLGRIHMRADQAERATEVLQTSIVQSEETEPAEAALTRTYQAEQYLRRGHHDLAAPLLANAIEVGDRYQLALVSSSARLLQVRMQFETDGQVDETVLQETRRNLRVGEFAREACDADFLYVRVSLDRRDLEAAATTLDELEPRVERVGSWVQQGELRYLQTSLQIERGDLEGGLTRLVELERWAKLRKLPVLRRACQKLMTEMTPSSVV